MMKKALCLLLAMLLLLGLCACGGSAAPTSNDAAPADAAGQNEAVEVPDVEYSISVTDQEGNPISGVMVQFCDDTACTTGETDKNGTAVFTAKEGSYTVHVLRVPEGFLGTDEEFRFSGTERSLGITLAVPVPEIADPIIGFSFYNPEKYESMKGTVAWENNQITNKAYVLSSVYYAVAKEDSAAFNELRTDLYFSTDRNNEVRTLFEVICVQMSEAEAEDYLKANIQPANGWENLTLEKVGSAENLTAFLVQEILPESDQKSLKEGMGEFYDEFMDLREDRETFLSGIQLQKPLTATMLFETQDLDGNTVNMLDVLADHKVTMVNLWATWCEPCKKELPDLQELSKTFEAQGCQIIGICLDYHAGEDTAAVKDILSEAGVTYLNLVAPENDRTLLPMKYYPTSYFVDSEGNILTDAVLGAYPVSVYKNALKLALSALQG
ncbi:MAG: redoxin domain-containing protein [Oscillospiraceae bacterium]|nr:redoxin domain-containing protein [Oscillospiraceae bacterium]